MKQLSADQFRAIPMASQPDRRSNDRRVIQRIALVCAALPSSLLIVLAISGDLPLTAAGIYILGLLLLMWSLIRFRVRRWWQGVALLVSTLNIIVVSPELILRTINFQHLPSVSFGGLRPERRTLFEPDNDLMWKHPPGQPGINSLGFRGDEIQLPKPEGVRRILFIGDSCTDQDFASYVEQLLNRQAGRESLRFECIIMAAPGYSSYQGKVIAEKYAGLVEADIAFVYFGWNDHWLAYGGTDAELAENKFISGIRGISHNSRLMQLAVTILPVLPGISQSVVEQVRVPPQQFRDNLRSISSILSSEGVRVVFVTAPSNHELAGVPPYLVEQRLAPNETFVLVRHREYCDIVRAVAGETGSGLLDLDVEMSALSYLEPFMSDGIHFTDTGLRATAVIIYLYLLQYGGA